MLDDLVSEHTLLPKILKYNFRLRKVRIIAANYFNHVSIMTQRIYYDILRFIPLVSSHLIADLQKGGS